jgi:phosphonate transport system substrate-binding protein
MIKATYISGLILTLLASQCFAQKPLVLGVHPYLDKNEIVSRFTPLVKYLEKAINRPIQLKVASNYRQHIDYIGKNNVDLAYIGPSSYVKMVRLHGKKPLLARLEINGKPHFKGKIFVRENSKIKHLHDLPGKDIAFGSRDSTMGSIVPLWTLQNEGIHSSQFNSFHHLSNHTNVAYSVLMGDFDAGASKEEIYHSFKSRGLREIGSTVDISEHLFVANNYLPRELIKKIKKALFNLDKYSLGKQVMNNIKHNMTDMVPVIDSNYDNLRKIESQAFKEDLF